MPDPLHARIGAHVTPLERLTYRINTDDVIVEVGDDWAAFARRNGATGWEAATVGRPLWDFVSGVTTRFVYRALLGRVRSGQSITFDYRCDAPALRRFMQMTMRPAAEGGVEFESATMRVEPREPLFAAATSPRTERLLVRMCSWCNRVAFDGTWCEVEVAAEALGLFAASGLPAITHAMCPSCLARYMGELDAT